MDYAKRKPNFVSCKKGNRKSTTKTQAIAKSQQRQSKKQQSLPKPMKRQKSEKTKRKND